MLLVCGLLWIASLVRGYVQDVSFDDLSDFILRNPQKYVFLKAYSTSTIINRYIFFIACGLCRTLKPEFEKLAASYHRFRNELDFLECNGTDYPEMAEEFQLSGFPTLLLFAPVPDESAGSGERSIVEFDKQRIAYEMCKFLEKQTGILFKVQLVGLPCGIPEPVPLLQFVSPSQLSAGLESGRPAFVMIHSSFDIYSRFFLSYFEQLVMAYQRDPIDIVVVDEAMHAKFASELGVSALPDFFLFKGSLANRTHFAVEIADSEDERQAKTLEMVEFINRECGLHRRLSGLYTETFGVNDGLADLVKDFLRAPSQAKLDSCPNPTYRQLMQLAFDYGSEYLKREAERIEMIQAGRWASRSIQDQNQVRMNILKSAFLPHIPASDSKYPNDDE